MSNNLFRWLLIIVWVGALGLDQVTKWWAQNHARVTFNTGLSLGWGGEAPWWVKAIGLGLGLAVLGCWWWWLAGRVRRRSRSDLQQRSFAVASIILWAGVVSNLLDRYFFSFQVRDWLSLPLIGISNNLADWYIGSSLVWLTALNWRD